MKCPNCNHEWKNSKQGRPAKVSREAVIELRSQGLSWQVIGERLGCSRVAAYTAAKGARRCDQKGEEKA